MDPTPERPTREDAPYLTLRVPTSFLALVVAAGLHVLLAWVIEQLPEPEPPPPPPLEFTLRPTQPPPPPAAEKQEPAPRRPAPPTPPRQVVKKDKEPTPEPAPPAVSPVAPELPPSDDPPDNRVQLPVVERVSPEPAPPPEPTTWEERLKAQLRKTTPRRPPAPTGVLKPPAGAVERVAASDPRLHDEETERRLMVDYGPFFRRGLEALRGNWKPNEVLRRQDRQVNRRCIRRTRTTFAVAVLDKEGHVVDVDLKEGSGCPDLDSEAVAAFKRVARFPRPPLGIFTGPDGIMRETARFPVRFIVTFDGGLRLDWP